MKPSERIELSLGEARHAGYVDTLAAIRQIAAELDRMEERHEKLMRDLRTFSLRANCGSFPI